jgi:hypothetical protein
VTHAIVRSVVISKRRAGMAGVEHAPLTSTIGRCRIALERLPLGRARSS